MPIIIHHPDKQFKIKFNVSKDDTVIVTFKQLSYMQRSLITDAITTVKEGEAFLDRGKECFLNIKHALVGITGVVKEDGKSYKLKYDDDGGLKDECVEALLGSNVSSGLLLIARNLDGGGIPEEIINPLTKVPFQHIEVLPDETTVKKK